MAAATETPLGTCISVQLARPKSVTLGALLIAIAVTGPLVAYAGISVIYPGSQKTFDINTTPPVTFAEGPDYALGESSGFLTAFVAAHNDAAYSFTVHGLSGASLTIDNLTEVTRTAAVASYKVQISAAYDGDLTVSTLKIRLWSADEAPGTPPTADGADNVCAVLDLTAALNTESATTCEEETVQMQLIMVLPVGTQQDAESATVSVRPSSIVFA